MNSLYEKLKAKGWAEHEIERTMNILKYGKANQKEIFYHNIHPNTVYWIGLMFLIAINIILSIFLVPLFFIIKHTYIYPIIILFALSFGYILNHILTDMEFNDPKHHTIAGFMILCFAIINIYTVLHSMLFIFHAKLDTNLFNPWIISIVYAISFTAPYIYHKIPHILEHLSKTEQHTETQQTRQEYSHPPQQNNFRYQ
jgi:hypothetical protein